MDDMTPTDELRRLLDERGIEYTIYMPWNDTEWEHDGTHFTANERFGKIYLQTSQESLTPEQAIAATVGVGTCRLVDNDSGLDMHCTACGEGVDDEYRYFMDSWGYSRCPHCGARIIKEVTE